MNDATQSLSPEELLKVSRKVDRKMEKVNMSKWEDAVESFQTSASRLAWLDEEAKAKDAGSFHVIVVLSDGVETVSSNKATEVIIFITS